MAVLPAVLPLLAVAPSVAGCTYGPPEERHNGGIPRYLEKKVTVHAGDVSVPRLTTLETLEAPADDSAGPSGRH